MQNIGIIMENEMKRIKNRYEAKKKMEKFHLHSEVIAITTILQTA